MTSLPAAHTRTPPVEARRPGDPIGRTVRDRVTAGNVTVPRAVARVARVDPPVAQGRPAISERLQALALAVVTAVVIADRIVVQIVVQIVVRVAVPSVQARGGAARC